ncbi:MAG: hypothetical protein AAF333_11600 [Planctomycetota bacterium]
MRTLTLNPDTPPTQGPCAAAEKNLLPPLGPASRGWTTPTPGSPAPTALQSRDLSPAG